MITEETLVEVDENTEFCMTSPCSKKEDILRNLQRTQMYFYHD